ncbi:PREDICTED: pre-mRNA 3' end processing protein WDR33 isoform X3 [Lepidothrix coronata]|uniref:Pre-mRNA 3' end processing protein WDR33 isoform X3 n=1 Tax=Lepidothrix coronata TaxID=321398 RepID=A0A6J0I6M0_9PASS|nr:PREDICTED: pre-mRNA 3' end processing protein WDR33 isoform X3 [Lepidothrix coronata]
MATEIGSPPRFFHMPRFQHQAPRQLFYKRPDFAQQQAMQQLTFDGKRMRKAVNRKTIDYNPSVIKYLENRVWQRDQRDMRAIQPDAGYYNDLVPPIGMLNNPMNAVTTKFVRTSTNKVKCPVFVVRWTPEGRRLVTGASSGEFTLWNGLTFNFETILQAHDSPVRAMTWSHNDMWMLTADHGGYVKYWQSNMNNVKMFQAHKEAIREASFSPTDNKFATCSDDGTVRIWDFLRCHEERILRGPHVLLLDTAVPLPCSVLCCVWVRSVLVAKDSKHLLEPVQGLSDPVISARYLKGRCQKRKKEGNRKLWDTL